MKLISAPSTLTVALSAALLTAGCATTEQPTPAAPSVAVSTSGTALAASIQGSATVEKIDRSTREVTLRRHDGSLVTLVAGEEVRNFDQIRVGDVVEAEIIEALAVLVEPTNTQVRERRDEITTSRARPGQRPAASMTRTVEIVATVQDVDPKARWITVRGALQTVQLKVDESVDLSRIKRGDNVRAVYIETISIRVVPARR
jgi:Cu/Ag efflux protein CusF